jgi:deazaflavin-dependent oxidoreductase (nitroreductase family)
MTQSPHEQDEPNQRPHYLKPDWFTRTVFNPTVAWLTRRGLSVMGSRELRVRGRKSGAWRNTPVNLLTVDGQRYLVAPRGTTQWVRNIRVSGGGELRVGRRVETFTVEELSGPAKLPVLREYLHRWRWEVNSFFPDLSKNPTDEELVGISELCPAFRIVTV